MKEQIALQNLLKNHFEEIQKKNPNFSLRSYANKIGINAGSLSSIMKGKRHVSLELAERLSKNILSADDKKAELIALFESRRMEDRSSRSSQVLDLNLTLNSHTMSLAVEKIKQLQQELLELSGSEDTADSFRLTVKMTSLSKLN